MENLKSLPFTTTIVKIKLNLKEIEDFCGNRLDSVPTWATIEKPFDVSPFCDIVIVPAELSSDKNCRFLTLSMNSEVIWEFLYEEGTDVVPSEEYVVFKLLNRPIERNWQSTFKEDWDQILDLKKTDGHIDSDGKLHINIDGNKKFQITSLSEMKLSFDLSYSIFFILKRQFTNISKPRYMYCKVDPLVRNNTDQGDC